MRRPIVPPRRRPDESGGLPTRPTAPPVRLLARKRREPVAREQAARGLPPPEWGGFHRQALRRAWAYFHQGSLSHWVTALIIAVSLTIYGVQALLLSNVETTLTAWQGEHRITVFLKQKADQHVAARLRDWLSQQPGVTAARVTPPREALASLRGMLGSQGRLLDDLPENPLPYAIECQVHGQLPPEQAASLASLSLVRDEVDAVVFDREWMERLAALVEAFRYVALSLSALLLAAVTLIVSNTIKLSIGARRNEIEVMRFVGATDAFIKTPFVYEGLLQGILGAVLALGLVALLQLGGQSALAELGRTFGLRLELGGLPPEQAALILGLGVVLGGLGALISLTRFLEE